MTIKNIEADYESYSKLYAEFEIANDQEKEVIRKEAKMLRSEIDAKGFPYKRMYLMYKSMMKRGNAYIDVHSTRDAEDVPQTLKMFKKFGVDTFTVSDSCANPDYIWEFLQNGCKLIGMEEINSVYTDFYGNYEKSHAYMLTVN